MALSDIVIATEQDISDLYRRDDCEKYYKVLKDLGLLPLTVETLTTPQGTALLHLATWTYLSGHISARQYTPTITLRPELHERVMEHLEPLGRELKINAKGVLRVAQDAGAFGRLLVAMGVPRPERGKQQKKYHTKTHYRNGLPHYFFDIVHARPRRRNPERRLLLNTIGQIIFCDRFRIYGTTTLGQRLVLHLNRHPTKKKAENYGKEVVSFFNSFLWTSGNKGIFDNTDLYVGKTPHDGLHKLDLVVQSKYLSNLARRDPPLLEIKTTY